MKQSRAVDQAVDLMRSQTTDWGWPLRPAQAALLRRYAEMLATYAQANVIGTKDLRQILLDHVLDSLSCLSLEEVLLQGKLIDVGTGGGLPGIPLAVAQPGLSVTLLEATEKKAAFLRSAKEGLNLAHLEVLNERAEIAGAAKAYREQYEVATSRALASLPVVLEYSAPFVKIGGQILAMKGRLEGDELADGRRAAAKLGVELQEVARVHLHPELEQKQRNVVVFRKIAATPTGYPRRVGLAKKRPLGG